MINSLQIAFGYIQRQSLFMFLETSMNATGTYLISSKDTLCNQFYIILTWVPFYNFIVFNLLSFMAFYQYVKLF